MTDFETLELIGNHDPKVREMIVGVCSRLQGMLLEKGSRYGNSALTKPILIPSLTPGQNIMGRASDKIARIAALNTGRATETADETLQDTVLDLAGYCVLWVVARMLADAERAAAETEA